MINGSGEREAWQPKEPKRAGAQAASSDTIKEKMPKKGMEMELTILHYRTPKENEEIVLAEIRARAMKESLVNVGRFDDDRVRKRLLDTYQKETTVIVEVRNMIVGFFSGEEQKNEYYLHHLYIDIPFQNQGFGREIMNHIKQLYHQKDIRLNALKGSAANIFYEKNGFIKESEDEFDNYYVYRTYRRTTDSR